MTTHLMTVEGWRGSPLTPGSTPGPALKSHQATTQEDTMGTITCIANSDMSKGPEVPLWECPCGECTKLDWEALDEDDRPSLRQHRIDVFPEVWAR